jgi:hypothetical protein
MISHQGYRFLFRQEAVRALEAPRTNDYLFIWSFLDVAKHTEFLPKPLMTTASGPFPLYSFIRRFSSSRRCPYIQLCGSI